MLPKKATVVAQAKKAWWVTEISDSTDFMKNPNRDLLVLVKDEFMTEKAIELEVARLNQLLYSVESFDNISVATELIDINRHRIYQKKKQIVNALKEKVHKPFVFINNLN